MNYKQELKNLESENLKFKKRIDIFRIAFKFSKQNETKKILRQILQRIPKYNRKNLIEQYRDLSEFRVRHGYKEIELGVGERPFEHRLKKESKFKYSRQTVVGPYFLDFFLPGVAIKKDEFAKGLTAKGIVFEIDGNIHEKEFKQKKDFYKDQCLGLLEIFVVRVQNHQAADYRVSKLLKDKKLNNLDSRSRINLMERISLITLLYFAQKQQLISLFRPKSQKILERYSI